MAEDNKMEPALDEFVGIVGQAAEGLVEGRARFLVVVWGDETDRVHQMTNDAHGALLRLNESKKMLERFVAERSEMAEEMKNRGKTMADLVEDEGTVQ